MKALAYYILALIFSLGGFEMVITAPLNIAYATAFLYLQGKNLKITGREDTLPGTIVFLITIVLGRLSIPIASDSGSPDYYLPILLGIKDAPAYTSMLSYFLELLILYNVVFFIISRKSGSTLRSFSYAALVGAVVVTVHVLPFFSVFQTAGNVAEFIEKTQVVSAEQIQRTSAPTKLFEIGLTMYSDKVYSDKNIQAKLLYRDRKGGELIQYSVYPRGYARNALLHIDSTGTIVRIEPAQGEEWYVVRSVAEDGSSLYILVSTPGEAMMYEVENIVK